MSQGTTIDFSKYEQQAPAIDFSKYEQSSGLGMGGQSLSNAAAVPNARLRNLPNPAAGETSALGALYHGAKTGATLGMLPAAAAAVPTTIPAAIGLGTGVAGGAAAGAGAKVGAKYLGAGDLGQEAAGDIGSVAGGVLGAGLGEAGATLGRRIWGFLPRDLQQEVLESFIPGAKQLKTAQKIGQAVKAVRAASEASAASPPSTAPVAGTTPGTAPAVASNTSVNIPAKTGPPTLGSLLKPADVQAAANKAVGYEPPTPGQPIAQRPTVPAATSPVEGLPPGHTPVESTAVKSYKYDPDSRTLEVHPMSGPTTYRYGDVSPEQAAEFQQSKSYGTAWAKIRQGGSPLIAKRVNGKWVSVKPVQPSQPASLGDLTGLLQQSLQQAQQK